MNDLIKELREITGSGILEVKNALSEAEGDKEKALEILRKKGATKFGKKADRVTKEGIVTSYIHPGGRIGVLIELNCETDFVARTEDFKNLANDLALHIAASSPLYVSQTDVSAEIIEKEKEFFKETLKNKPAEMVEKIVEGKLEKYYEEICLLNQPFVKNPDIKIKDFLGQAVGKLGENISVKRFSRFVLGN